MANCKDCIHYKVCYVVDQMTNLQEYKTAQDLKDDCETCILTSDVAPKSEVAMEIFEDIEQIIENSKYQQLTPFGTEERYNPYLIKKHISELKKKYTEDQT